MTRRSEVAALKARWTAEALAAADLAFCKMDPVAAFQRKPPPHPFVSPFGEHEGRADFRYVSLGATPSNRTIERADLTGSTDSRGGQLCCSLVDCLLDRASMETNLGGRGVTRLSSFVRAKFTHTTFRGMFIECDFSHCDLSYSGGGQVAFVSCRFVGAKFVGSGFDFCRFEHCAWEGAKIGNAAFAHAHFVGNWPTPEQLRDAMTPGAVFDPGSGLS
jgi:uncharacterized protein YjbI with pentapeptide repeats